MRTRATDLVLLAVAAVWGSSYLAAKVATEVVAVPVVLLARFGLAAVACLAACASRPGLGSRISRQEWAIGSVLGVTQAAVIALETYGVAHTTAANAGVLISLTIILTPIIDVRRGGARLPKGYFLAAAVCVLGAVLLVGGPDLDARRPGDLLILAAAVVRSVHVVLIGRFTDRRALRPLGLTTVQTIVGTALFVPVALPALGQATGITVGWWVAVVYLALACSVFAFLAQTWAVQRTSPSRASLLLGTEPVWAVGCAAFVGDERIALTAAIGAALVVGGTYRGQAVERHHNQPASYGAPCPAPTTT